MTETNITPHLDNDVSAEFTEATLSTDDIAPNLIPLTQFIQDFGEGLMAAVATQNPPIYDGTPNPVWEAVMNSLKRQPFVAQRERVQAVCKLLVEDGAPAAVLNGEMGTGKTMMGIAAAAVLYPHGYHRTLRHPDLYPKRISKSVNKTS